MDREREDDFFAAAFFAGAFSAADFFAAVFFAANFFAGAFFAIFFTIFFTALFAASAGGCFSLGLGLGLGLGRVAVPTRTEVLADESDEAFEELADLLPPRRRERLEFLTDFGAHEIGNPVDTAARARSDLLDEIFDALSRLAVAAQELCGELFELGARHARKRGALLEEATDRVLHRFATATRFGISIVGHEQRLTPNGSRQIGCSSRRSIHRSTSAARSSAS